MSQDYYAILGIPSNASEREIRNAYRRLARKYHPDVNSGSKQSELRFKEINEAYQTLANSKTRMEYDSFGLKRSRHQSSYQGGNVTRGSGSSRSYKRYGGSESVNPNAFGDLFAEMFRGNHRNQHAYDPFTDLIEAPPIEMSIKITLEEAYFGTNRVISMATPPATNDSNRRIEVRIPRGVGSGSRIHVNLERPAFNRKSLYVIVTVAAHRIFNRRGDDLNTKVDLPLPDAVLGGEVQVPTIKGTTVSLKVPPETQNGRVFRLKGQGMPHLRSVAGGASEQLGDLLVTMDVKVPTALNDEERALFARLRELRSL